MRSATLAVMLLAQTALPPSSHQIQQWFEAGNDQQVVEASASASDPEAKYLTGLSYQRLNRLAEARQVFESLAARPETDAWAHIGHSAALLSQAAAGSVPVSAAAEAEQAARRAIELAPGLSLGHYQLGRVQGQKKDFGQAVSAFEQVIALEPRFAYAHYFVGLSYYEINRTDKMAGAFEYFLKLAPDAPERGQVESIMRTLRGR